MGLQGNAQPGAPKESRGPRRPSARGGGRHLPSEAVLRGPRCPGLGEERPADPAVGTGTRSPGFRPALPSAAGA